MWPTLWTVSVWKWIFSLASDPADLLHRLDSPDLVVRVHYRYKHRLFGDGGGEIIDVDKAVFVHIEIVTS